ncbi:hypothetical protein IFR05_012355 [Cadophora sp. M221]|nr:hypothetical protein IFR05_012355 [Cadophora sp. M221]
MSNENPNIAEHPTHSSNGRPLARVQYIEPETSLDPWKCNYFSLPIAKEVIHVFQPLNDLRPEIFSPRAPTLSPHTLSRHSSTTYDILIPEIKEILKSVTGAKTIHVLGLGIRLKEADPDTRALREQNPNAELERCGIDLPVKSMDMTVPYMGGYEGNKGIGPARSIHIDFSPDGARQILRHVRGHMIKSTSDIVEAEDATVAAGKDIAFYSGRWYAILLVCIEFERDLVEHVNKQPSDSHVDYLAGLSMLKGDRAEEQKWYWIREQNVDEVFVLQFMIVRRFETGDLGVLRMVE